MGGSPTKLTYLGIAIAAIVVPAPAKATPKANGKGTAREPNQSAKVLATATQSPATLPAQPSCATGTLFHPKGPGRGQWHLGIGAEIDILPRALVEAELRYVPRLRAEFRYGLPANFQLDLRLSGNIFMNQAEAGAIWSFKAGPVQLGMGERFGVFGGAIGVAGFDAAIWGFTTTPSFLAGIPIQNSYLSFRTEALFTLKQSIRFGETSVQPSFFPLASISEAIRVETPLPKGLIAYGIDLIYAVADQQLWLVFSDKKGRVLFPRFAAAYVF